MKLIGKHNDDDDATNPYYESRESNYGNDSRQQAYWRAERHFGKIYPNELDDNLNTLSKCLFIEPIFSPVVGNTVGIALLQKLSIHPRSTRRTSSP